jgi:hypothetical protein
MSRIGAESQNVGDWTYLDEDPEKVDWFFPSCVLYHPTETSDSVPFTSTILVTLISSYKAAVKASLHC